MNLPQHEFGCIVCVGVVKGKCNFCGFKKPKKDDCTKEEWDIYCSWENYIKYLRKTRHKLKVENMVSSGCPELDEKIIHYLGKWTTKRLVTFVSRNDLPDGLFWEKVKETIKSEVIRLYSSRVRLVNIEYKDITIFNCIFDGKEKDIMECVNYIINDLYEMLEAYA